MSTRAIGAAALASAAFAVLGCDGVDRSLGAGTASGAGAVGGGVDAGGHGDGGAPDGPAAGSTSGSGGAGGVGASGKVPIFIAQGNVGRTIVSCDDGHTWVGNHSWAEGDALMCDIPQPDVICFQSTCSYFVNGQCTQSMCCNDTPDIPEGIAFGHDVFVGAWGHGQPGALRTSSTGVDWTTTHISQAFSIAFGGDRFVAAGNPSTYWSVDGITWTQGGAADFDNTSPVRSFGYGDYDGGGRFVSTAAGAGLRDILVSSDGALSWWRPSDIPDDCALGVGTGGGDILSGNGILLIVDQHGNACRSTDGGDHWFVSPTGLTSIPSHGMWSGSEFLYWGNDSPGTAAPATAMISSSDGVTWKQTPMVTSTRIGPVARSDSGTFVAIPYYGDKYETQHFLRSTDGVTWESLPMGSFVQSHAIFRMTFGYADPSGVCPGME